MYRPEITGELAQAYELLGKIFSSLQVSLLSIFCEYREPTPMELLYWMLQLHRPQLYITLIFWLDVHLHLEIRWMPWATDQSVTYTPHIWKQNVPRRADYLYANKGDMSILFASSLQDADIRRSVCRLFVVICAIVCFDVCCCFLNDTTLITLLNLHKAIFYKTTCLQILPWCVGIMKRYSPPLSHNTDR